MVSGRDVCCVCVLTRENLFARRRASMGGKWEANAVDITNFWHSTMQTARHRLGGSGKNIMKKPWRRHMSAREGRFKLRIFFLSPKLLQYFKWKHVNLLAFDDWEKSSNEMFVIPQESSTNTPHMRAEWRWLFFCFSIIRLITVACEREKWNMRVKHKPKGAKLSASAQLLRCTVYTSELWLN